MSMRDRLRRRPQTVSSAGPEEETVRIAHRDFRRRRRAGRWRTLRWVVLSMLLVAAVGASAWLVLFSSHVTARDVEVSGTATLAEGRVERAARVPVDTPLARVDLDAVRARVESIATVRRAEVSRAWPHAVRIAVTERTPVAVIDQGDGLRAIDVDGVLFGTYDRRPPGVPLVRTAPGTADEALLEGARVIASLPPRVLVQVERVEVASVDEIELVLGTGRRVLWGSAQDSGQKAEVLAVLLRRPGQQIDVSVPGRPTTR